MPRLLQQKGAKNKIKDIQAKDPLIASVQYVIKIIWWVLIFVLLIRVCDLEIHFLHIPTLPKTPFREWGHS